MAIQWRTGDIWKSGAETVVVPVNCVGIMGKGMALQCKRRYPRVYGEYIQDCARRLIEPGDVFHYQTWDASAPQKWVLCAATKNHWRAGSQLRWVERCIREIDRTCCADRNGVVAVPMLGCGLGGLKWEDVRPIMEERLGESTETTFLVYE